MDRIVPEGFFRRALFFGRVITRAGVNAHIKEVVFMKHRKGLILIFAVMALALVFAGCGGGSSDSGPSATPITSSQEGSQASASTVQAVTMAQGSFSMFQGLSGFSSQVAGAPALPSTKMNNSLGSNDVLETAARLTAKLSNSGAAKAAAAAIKRAGGLAPTTYTVTGQPCGVSGTMDIDAVVDEAAGTGDIAFTFHQCVDFEDVIDGTLSMHVTQSSAVLNANVTIDGYNGGTLEETLTMNNLTFTQTATSGGANSMTFTVTASGSISVVNHITGETGTITYSRLSQTVTATFDVNETVSITTNGGISIEFSDNSGTYSLSVTYRRLVLSATFTASYSEFSTNGTVSFNFEPNDFCFEGTYVITTVTPIREENNQTVAGEVHINDNVIITFNPDGSVTVTVSGASEDFLSIDDLEGVCEFVVLS